METTHHHHPQPPSPASHFNLNHHHQPPQDNFLHNNNHHHHLANKEPMFQKPLTPSDVGKLNRLVIPKQHAEKYFPLGADQQKGLLLSFEDESGKLWRFRYSYWNSSQSYVLTKGWSRYVKEKKLDAGDVVLFERNTLDCEKMFIGWRRRSAAVPFGVGTAAQAVVVGGGGQGTAAFHDAQFNYPSHPSLPLSYQPDFLHAGGVFENVDNCQRGAVVTRRLRLFGVNLECPDNSEPSTSDGSSHGGHSDHQYSYNSSDLYNNMQMRYQQHEEG
ncbi:hypothetical protein L6452_24348 [Arctium lappa]|uniref:Uncharacterized protein n=1 Tax=Arctium lappa TaxID=4217 RepID=A0ACB9AAH6_ARCLA|nr:hypothetical protein L6452_24348 [Arctium lappa]